MKLKSAELSKQTRKGDLYPPEVNAIAMRAVRKIGNQILFAMFNRADSGKWHGDLVYTDKDEKVAEFKFRKGICQFYKLPVYYMPDGEENRMSAEGTTVFRMNVINDAVDFREEKNERNQGHS